MRPGVTGQADAVRVLLDGRFRDLLGGLVQAGVDDLEARVAQCPGHHLCSTVVSVETRLRHEDPDRTRHGLLRRAASAAVRIERGRLRFNEEPALGWPAARRCRTGL